MEKTRWQSRTKPPQWIAESSACLHGWFEKASVLTNNVKHIFDQADAKKADGKAGQSPRNELPNLVLVCIVGLKKHRSWQKMSSTYLTKPMQKTRWQSRTKRQWIAVKWRIYLTPSALWTNGSILFRCFGKLQESITKALSFPQDESSGWGLAKSVSIQSHRIHVKRIFTYIWLIFMVNVGKYASHMDPMGVDDSKKKCHVSHVVSICFPRIHA